ncbi:hypothetical protein TRFO_29656 [Tritrichomonas foetus]|uniref:Uncharacterized protein n=1 Tax=Tritrichomonas foetus TaxID=1144522 RepID=A0A1J4JX51_9EUKA|nr:hypothetical protein TRFO_29656 [Tritrichomonas foetus]|eukprot:OHT03040.1 hypothetical protein TRFO_29656 [Tritrichomonas foetus]
MIKSNKVILSVPLSSFYRRYAPIVLKNNDKINEVELQNFILGYKKCEGYENQGKLGKCLNSGITSCNQTESNFFLFPPEPIPCFFNSFADFSTAMSNWKHIGVYDALQRNHYFRSARNIGQNIDLQTQKTLQNTFHPVYNLTKEKKNTIFSFYSNNKNLTERKVEKYPLIKNFLSTVQKSNFEEVIIKINSNIREMMEYGIAEPIQPKCELYFESYGKTKMGIFDWPGSIIRNETALEFEKLIAFKNINFENYIQPENFRSFLKKVSACDKLTAQKIGVIVHRLFDISNPNSMKYIRILLNDLQLLQLFLVEMKHAEVLQLESIFFMNDFTSMNFPLFNLINECSILYCFRSLFQVNCFNNWKVSDFISYKLAIKLSKATQELKKNRQRLINIYLNNDNNKKKDSLSKKYFYSSSNIFAPKETKYQNILQANKAERASSDHDKRKMNRHKSLFKKDSIQNESSPITSEFNMESTDFFDSIELADELICDLNSVYFDHNEINAPSIFYDYLNEIENDNIQNNDNDLFDHQKINQNAFRLILLIIYLPYRPLHQILFFPSPITFFNSLSVNPSCYTEKLKAAFQNSQMCFNNVISQFFHFNVFSINKQTVPFIIRSFVKISKENELLLNRIDLTEIIEGFTRSVKNTTYLILPELIKLFKKKHIFLPEKDEVFQKQNNRIILYLSNLIPSISMKARKRIVISLCYILSYDSINIVFPQQFWIKINELLLIYDHSAWKFIRVINRKNLTILIPPNIIETFTNLFTNMKMLNDRILEIIFVLINQSFPVISSLHFWDSIFSHNKSNIRNYIAQYITRKPEIFIQSQKNIIKRLQEVDASRQCKNLYKIFNCEK